jgi:putative transposase
MSWVSIWIHLVFSTKNREHFLDKEIRKNVFEHIKINANKKDIYIEG